MPLAAAADAAAADATCATPRATAWQRHLLDVDDDPVVFSVAPDEGHLPPLVRGTGRDVGRGLPGGGEEGRRDRRGRGAGGGGGGA